MAPASARADELVHTGANSPGAISVTKTGSVYSLKFVGDEIIDYRIDLADPMVTGGVVRVFEASSGCYPLYKAGMMFRRNNGTTPFPDMLAATCSLTGQSMTADSVVLDYTDNFDGIHHRRNTYKIVGKTLRVRVQDMDQNLAFSPNYTGVFVGPTESMPNAKIIQMQGALSTPLVLFKQGSQNYFFANMLDLTQSHASDWNLPIAKTVVPGPTSIAFSAETTVSYKALTDGKLADEVDDTISVVVSKKIADVLVTPTQDPSPYRELLEDRTIVLLSGNNPWPDYTNLYTKFAQWGMDNIAGYIFNWTSSAPDPPGSANAGPDWFPAVNSSAFGPMINSGIARGFLLGAYCAFNVMPITAPASVYNAAHIARTSAGAWKLSAQSGVPLIAEGAAGIHAHREATLAKTNYGCNLAYVDISTYSGPSKGADGDHVDQLATSPYAKTLQQAIAARKAWMLDMTSILNGPLLGEGSIATQGSNLEWLWPGYCDSVQRCINSGANKPANQIAAGDPKAVTNWPVIPEFEYRVMAKGQVNHGNGFMDRFLGPSDPPTMFNATAKQPIFPFTEPALDRYRAYELTYGHSSYFQTNGPYNGVGNVTWFADMIKEYYLCNALQSHYLGSRASQIHYLYQGTLQTFEQILFQTGTTDTFRDPKIRILFRDGLQLYVNHNPTPWTVNASGTNYLIPEDGFLAFIPGTQFIAFSAIPPTTGGQRIDYCYAPGQWEMMDGRGQISAYGNLSTTAKRLKVQNFAYNLTVTESATGGVITPTSGPAPILVSVDVQPANTTLAASKRIGMKAFARYNNGSFRNVTTLVSWTSSAPGVAKIDGGAALTALAPGQATIGMGTFQGVPITPATVTVQ